MLKTEFGLAEFYKEQSRLTDDLDQASDEGLLDVITALAANYKTPLEFFKFICKSMADQEGNSESGTEKGNPERENPNANEVYLSTIHRAKGKEFRNVVYFNLSQAAADPKKAFFVEEERRVAYVGRDAAEGRSADHLRLHQAVRLSVGDRPQPGLRRPGRGGMEAQARFLPAPAGKGECGPGAARGEKEKTDRFLP